LDVWLAVDSENARRASEALQAFGFSARSVPSSKFLDRQAVFAFGREPFRVDLLMDPSGVDFEECYQRRVQAVLEGISIPFISAGQGTWRTSQSFN
jgi:hypothetical protein